MSDFEHVFDKPPEGAAEDWTIPQDWRAYTETEHKTWDILYARQMKILPGRAADVFFKGLKALDLNTGGIPDFSLMNPKLQALTGWTVVCVPGLVPDEVFFDHLANRRFPSGQFIRKPDQLDYLQEPDIFHDVFGHVPMLTDPDFAAYMEAYGKGGQRAASAWACCRTWRGSTGTRSSSA
jgi:phenylalanine-4-hydroxylase